MKFFSKSKFFGVALVTFMSVGYTACDGSGVSCDSKEMKNLLAESIKADIIENSPKNLVERFEKIKIIFDDIVTKEKYKLGEKEQGYYGVNFLEVRACGAKTKVQLDTGDTLSYDGELIYMTQLIEGGELGVTTDLNASSSKLYREWVKDIKKNLQDYYSGKGIMIDGKRKGGCNGSYQEKDKNGEITLDGACENGLKMGAWKYYSNGFLIQEENYKDGLLNLVKFYDRSQDNKIIATADYVDGKLNGFIKTYANDGSLMKAIPYKNGVIDGIGFDIQFRSFGRFGDFSDITIDARSESRKDINEIKRDSNYQTPDYFEVVNGEDIVHRFYGYGEDANEVAIGNGLISVGVYGRLTSCRVKTKEELSDCLHRIMVRSESIQIKNLDLRLRGSYLGDFIEFGLYKNGEQIGSGKFMIETGEVVFGRCGQGKCEETFKELIDKSAYKQQIYDILSGKKTTKFDNPTQSKSSAEKVVKPQNTSEISSEVPNSATPNEQSTNKTQNSAETSASKQSGTKEQIKPSFDCSKASTNAEKLVCSDNELASLDNELSKAYSNARNSLDSAGKKKLTSEQKAWLATYNKCVDKECVKQNLEKRINELRK